jgi:hypothetical protein
MWALITHHPTPLDQIMRTVSQRPSTAAVQNQTQSSRDPLAQLRRAVPVDGQVNSKLTSQPSQLTPEVSDRLNKAKAALEKFAFNHTDMGDSDSGISMVKGAGYAVWASGGDDRGGFSASAVAYYDLDGHLLDVDTRSKGVSDSEESGDWENADQAKLAAETKALRAAVSFSAKKQSADLDPTKAKRIDIKDVQGAAGQMISKVQQELEASTFEHADMGNTATRLYSITGNDGAVAGYALTSEGGDDADRWSAGGVTLISAQGQLIDRQIATTGRADNMSDDAVA